MRCRSSTRTAQALPFARYRHIRSARPVIRTGPGRRRAWAMGGGWLAGAGLGLLAAAGLVLAVRASPAMRPVRLVDRLAPYLGDTPPPSRAAGAAVGDVGAVHRRPAAVRPGPGRAGRPASTGRSAARRPSVGGSTGSARARRSRSSASSRSSGALPAWCWPLSLAVGVGVAARRCGRRAGRAARVRRSAGRRARPRLDAEPSARAARAGDAVGVPGRRRPAGAGGGGRRVTGRRARARLPAHRRRAGPRPVVRAGPRPRGHAGSPRRSASWPSGRRSSRSPGSCRV